MGYKINIFIKFFLLIIRFSIKLKNKNEKNNIMFIFNITYSIKCIRRTKRSRRT